MPEDRVDPSVPGRFVAAALGALFVVLAVVILAISDRTAGPIVAALLLGGLGLEALVSAVRNRRAWLSRIGPLP